MSKKSGMGKFILGAGLGAGLALLFAPQEGSKTRRELKIKFNELVEKAKLIDTDDVKADILQRVEELRMQVKDLDKEKALEIAKSQAKKIEKKANELYEVAKEKGTPVVEKAVSEVKDYALKAAKEKCKAVLLEPIMKVVVDTPEEYMGNVMGDLTSRRGRPLGQESIGNVLRITALVPLSEMFGYMTDLRSNTQGRANFQMEKDHYEEVPKSIAEEIIKKNSVN